MKNLFFFLLLGAHTSLWSEPCQEITLFSLPSTGETLTKSVGERIRLRGFLYQSEIGEMILAAEPNLPTCCVGGNKGYQIHVEGIDTLPDRHRAVSIEGLLIQTPENIFFLQEAIYAHPPIRKGGWVSFLWMVGLFALLLAFFLSQQRYRTLAKKHLFGIYGENTIS